MQRWGLLLENQECRFFVIDKAPDFSTGLHEEVLNGAGAAIAQPNPDDLGWGPLNEGQLVKIRVLGNDGEFMLDGKFPDAPIMRRLQFEITHMSRTGIQM